MHQFYDEHISLGQKQFTLNEIESGHACRVLRLKNQDIIEILNGIGGRFKAIIIDNHPKKCIVEVIEEFQDKPQQSQIHIAIAPTKNMDRMEWFVEKATEIGVTHISFLQCKNNERKVLKLDRIEKILVAAMKQSKRTFLPVLTDLTNFNEFVKANPNGYIAHCNEGEKSNLLNQKAVLNTPILIGPEGDFTIDEVKFAQQNGYHTIDLGENRLRTETAGLYACMMAKIKNSSQ